SGSSGAGRAALLAADWTHNASLQSVVLAVEQAYFLYLGTKALLDAQQTTLKEAQTNLEAAEQRHRVGLATIADVLQARTALSQARLALQATQGDLQTTRGGLALSMGLPANITYDIEVVPDTTLPLGVVEGVDTLLRQSLRARPGRASSIRWSTRCSTPITGSAPPRSRFGPAGTCSPAPRNPSRWRWRATRREPGAYSTCSPHRLPSPPPGHWPSRRGSRGIRRSHSSRATWGSSDSTDRARSNCKPTRPERRNNEAHHRG